MVEIKKPEPKQSETSAEDKFFTEKGYILKESQKGGKYLAKSVKIDDGIEEFDQKILQEIPEFSSDKNFKYNEITVDGKKFKARAFDNSDKGYYNIHILKEDSRGAFKKGSYTQYVPVLLGISIGGHTEINSLVTAARNKGEIYSPEIIMFSDEKGITKFIVKKIAYINPAEIKPISPPASSSTENKSKQSDDEGENIDGEV